MFPHGHSSRMLREGIAMRFVLVNHRAPKKEAWCALCCEKIDDLYLREIDTGLIYCSHLCYRGHVEVAVLALEYHAREVS